MYDVDDLELEYTIAEAELLVLAPQGTPAEIEALSLRCQKALHRFITKYLDVNSECVSMGFRCCTPHHEFACLQVQSAYLASF